MRDIAGWLSSENGFVPRKVCGAWTPETVLLHNTSDFLIFLAYMAIPAALIYLSWGKKIPFKSLFIFFSLFITSCGIGHLLEVVVFTRPYYNLIGVWKAATAAVSWATIIALLYYRKQILSLRPASELERVHEEKEVAQTKQAEAETELRRVNSRLEELVRERTAELEEANGRLLEADKAKNEFLAMLSHELRNPLAPISTSLMIIKESQNPHAVRDAKGVMERQVSHLKKLVDDLLDTQRIRHGKIALQKDSFAIQCAVKAAHEAVSAMTTKDDFQIFIDLPEGDIWLNGDQDRIVQVFTNLFNNSIKFARPQGQLVVRVETTPDHVVVHFKDDGCGITADLLPRVCEPYVQGQQGIDRPQGGLGIGLSLVKYIVEAHQGTINISSPGKDRGASVTVRLPTVVSRPANGKPIPPAKSMPKTDMKIMVVDDNVDAAESMAWLLKIDGYNVIGTVHNGREAVDVAIRTRPDVILLDLGLPGMNGFEVCRHVREHLPKCLIIAVTGWGSEEDRKKSLEAGFDRHLVKPVDPGELRRILSG